MPFALARYKHKLGFLRRIGPRTIQRALWFAAVFTTFIVYYIFADIANSKVTDTLVGVYSKSIVVSSVKGENTDWFRHDLRSWRSSVYVVDDEESVLKVPSGRGRESMVYLT